MSENRQPISLCLACGARKAGPTEACASCRHQPRTKDELARHLLVAARELTEEEAESISAAIREGREIEFSQDSLLTMRAALDANKPDPHWLLLWVSVLGIPALALLAWWLLS